MPPDRAVCPLPPRPLVLPCPELSPLPKRFVRCFAPGRGFKLCNRMVMLARSRPRVMNIQERLLKEQLSLLKKCELGRQYSGYGKSCRLWQSFVKKCR